MSTEAITNRIIFPRGYRHELDDALDITNRTVYDAYEGALARRLDTGGNSSEHLAPSSGDGAHTTTTTAASSRRPYRTTQPLPLFR